MRRIVSITTAFLSFDSNSVPVVTTPAAFVEDVVAAVAELPNRLLLPSVKFIVETFGDRLPLVCPDRGRSPSALAKLTAAIAPSATSTVLSNGWLSVFSSSSFSVDELLDEEGGLSRLLLSSPSEVSSSEEEELEDEVLDPEALELEVALYDPRDSSNEASDRSSCIAMGSSSPLLSRDLSGSTPAPVLTRLEAEALERLILRT